MCGFGRLGRFGEKFKKVPTKISDSELKRIQNRPSQLAGRDKEAKYEAGDKEDFYLCETRGGGAGGLRVNVIAE